MARERVREDEDVETRRGVANRRRIELLEVYAVRVRAAKLVCCRVTDQKKHKIITRTTRQAVIEHEDVRRCAFNTPLTRLRPGLCR